MNSVRVNLWKAMLAAFFMLSGMQLSSTAMASDPTSCSWQGATVYKGQWLECKSCTYRYCQCQPNGAWGSCTNNAPSTGSCDWTNPDWSNPACTDGGSKPCDWTNPDWSNPSCNSSSNKPCDWTNPDWSNPSCNSGSNKPCDWTKPDWTNPNCSSAGTPTPSNVGWCYYKHKKDHDSVHDFDVNHERKSCSKGGHDAWAETCRDHNGDTDEVGCW